MDGALTAVGTSVGANLYDTPMSYVEQWNLDIQRELPGNIVFDAAYAGNHGLKLPVNINANTLDTRYYGAPGDATKVAQLNALVANPFFGLISPRSALGAAQIQANQYMFGIKMAKSKKP